MFKFAIVISKDGPPCAVFRRIWKNRPECEFQQFFIPVTFRPNNPIPILDPISPIVNPVTRPLTPTSSTNSIDTINDELENMHL